MNNNILEETPAGGNGLHLQLPWPESVLLPNRKATWKAKLRPNRMARDAGYYVARERGVKLSADEYYRVLLVFCPPNRYHYDLDNLVAAMKPALDGMCLWLGVDDSHFQPVPDWGPVVARGKVEVTITAREAHHENPA